MIAATTRFLAALTASSLLLAPVATGQDGDQMIPDDDLIAELESDLASARTVPDGNVHVTVQEGVVTLRGNVPTLLAKERAVHRARLHKGVRSVVDLLEVAPSDVTDEQLTQEVRSALLSDPATDAWELDVEVQDGTVTLSGEVDSHAERNLARTVARNVHGIRGLDDQMTVAYALDRLDAEIVRDIEQRLHWDARIEDSGIDVAVRDGNVTLSGTVGSASERSLARADAWVAGVQSVDDEALDVRWVSDDTTRVDHRWVPRTDDEIRTAVKDAMLYDPRVLSFKPDVKVDDGIVTLKGTVDNIKARQAAAEDARNTAGVHRVHNLLDVVFVEPRPSDDEIAATARKALARDVIVHDEDIDVAVNRQQVVLTGEVSSYFAREQAQDVIARLNGVTDIRNELQVSYPAPGYAHTYYYYDWDPVLYGFDLDTQVLHMRPDEEIRKEIAQELWWSPFIDRDQVTIHVEDGVATLTGTVDSWMERDAATENAFEGGAYRVINELDISYGPRES